MRASPAFLSVSLSSAPATVTHFLSLSLSFALSFSLSLSFSCSLYLCLSVSLSFYTPAILFIPLPPSPLFLWPKPAFGGAYMQYATETWYTCVAATVPEGSEERQTVGRRLSRTRHQLEELLCG